MAIGHVFCGYFTTVRQFLFYHYSVFICLLAGEGRCYAQDIWPRLKAKIKKAC